MRLSKCCGVKYVNYDCARRFREFSAESYGNVLGKTRDAETAD